MDIKRVEIRVVDNGYVIIWDETTNDIYASHEEIVDTKANLKTKLMELFA